MPKMIVAFDADITRIGTTVDMDDETARIAVREGRARYADADADADAETAPEPAAAAAAPAAPVMSPPAPGIVEP